MPYRRRGGDKNDLHVSTYALVDAILQCYYRKFRAPRESYGDSIAIDWKLEFQIERERVPNVRPFSSYRFRLAFLSSAVVKFSRATNLKIDTVSRVRRAFSRGAVSCSA